MKHGCMIMTLRLSSSCRSGSHQIHCSRKKRIKFTAMSSPCWSFFPTSKALSTRNSYPLVKPSMASFTVRFWSGWGRASAQTSRQVEEKQLVSPPWQCARSHITRSTIPYFQNHNSDSPPPYLPDLAPCDFFLFPKMKLRLKGRHFDTTEGIHAETQEVIDIHLRTSRDAWNHGKHAGIAVYMPKGTTSKETVKTRSCGKKLFFMVKFPEFLGSPTYNHRPNWIVWIAGLLKPLIFFCMYRMLIHTDWIKVILKLSCVQWSRYFCYLHFLCVTLWVGYFICHWACWLAMDWMDGFWPRTEAGTFSLS